MIRDEAADAYARMSSGWADAKLREAYRAGWNDAERNFMDKVEAMQRVMKEERANADEAGNL